jgi:hypothetical protein
MLPALLETLSPILKNPASVDLDSLPDSRLVDETMLADWLGESVSSLQKWWVSGNGPKFVKNPKSVRYRVGDVRDWIAQSFGASPCASMPSNAATANFREYSVST